MIFRSISGPRLVVRPEKCAHIFLSIYKVKTKGFVLDCNSMEGVGARAEGREREREREKRARLLLSFRQNLRHPRPLLVRLRPLAANPASYRTFVSPSPLHPTPPHWPCRDSSISPLFTEQSRLSASASVAAPERVSAQCIRSCLSFIQVMVFASPRPSRGVNLDPRVRVRKGRSG
jgi:hypothetical protein